MGISGIVSSDDSGKSSQMVIHLLTSISPAGVFDCLTHLAAWVSDKKVQTYLSSPGPLVNTHLQLLACMLSFSRYPRARVVFQESYEMVLSDLSLSYIDELVTPHGTMKPFRCYIKSKFAILYFRPTVKNHCL